jgi:hypothetical protein
VATDSETITVTVNEVTDPPAPVGNLARVDAGFENGTDGASLVPPWTLSSTAAGLPQHYEYDSARAKVGTMSAWIQGAGITSYRGVRETESAGITRDGDEITLWVYLDTLNENRAFEDYRGPVDATNQVSYCRFDNLGQILTWTDHLGNPNGYTTGAYTPIGTYAIGWTQFRIVHNFTTQTYTLSMRADAGDAWTPLKAAGAADNNIPFRGVNTITETHGMAFSASLNANMWVDEVQYTDHTAPVITVDGVADGLSYPDPATITFSAIDDVDPAPVTTATLDSVLFTSGTVVSAPGAHVLVVTSTDASGNTATTTINFTIEAAPDTTAPVITVSGVADGGSYTGPVAATFSAIDAVDGPVTPTATLNGVPYNSGTEISAVGAYVLVVTASDGVPNTATTTINFTIAATQPPVVSTPASSAWSLAMLAVLGLAAPVIRRRRA